MEKYIIVLITLLSTNLAAFATGVPKAVTDAFAKKFPAAVEVKWVKENKKEHEANFKLNGKGASANFFVDGSWTETELEINVAELPVAVFDAVKTTYAGAVFLETFRIEKADGSGSYEVEIKIGSKKREIILHADGTPAR